MPEVFCNGPVSSPELVDWMLVYCMVVRCGCVSRIRARSFKPYNLITVS